MKSLRWACFLIFTKNSPCQSFLSVPFLAIPTQIYRTNEIIIPHQTTLLKLLDSYLQSLPNLPKLQFEDVLRIHESLGSFLAKRFFALSEYAQKAIHKSLGMTPYNANRGPFTSSSDSISSDSDLGGPLDKTSALQQINLMLVKACEGLVLVTQCMVSVTLGSEMQRERIEKGDLGLKSYVEMKNFFNRKKYQESGMAESLIGASFCFQSVVIRYILPQTSLPCWTSFCLVLILENPCTGKGCQRNQWRKA